MFINQRILKHMRQLVAEELVVQVIPGRYVNGISSFAESFAHHLEELDEDLTKRRSRFAAGYRSRIHLEKLGPIEDVLLDQSLASPSDDYPWYEAEAETATDFMAYLAGCLGQQKEIRSTPVTHDIRQLDRLYSSELPLAYHSIHLGF